MGAGTDGGEAWRPGPTAPAAACRTSWQSCSSGRAGCVAAGPLIGALDGKVVMTNSVFGPLAHYVAAATERRPGRRLREDARSPALGLKGRLSSDHGRKYATCTRSRSSTATVLT
jgi:hypothetical protein